MPKVTRYPGLRHHIRKSKRTGKVSTYYFLDKRMFGTAKDIPCGKDHAEAVKVWDEYRNHKPRVKGTLEEAFAAWEKEVLPLYTNAGTAKNYRLSLARLRRGKGSKPGVEDGPLLFGIATWDAVRLKHLKDYLKARKAKRQANHEMSLLSIIWNWARTEGYTDLPWPAAGMEKARWKNKEQARTFAVSDAVFDAVYACAEPMLRDCMDLASATGLRLTDCRGVMTPTGETLQIRSSKTGKAIAFEASSSPVLAGLLSRRRQLKIPHLFLLTTEQGKPVTESSLRGAWERARHKAATKANKAGDEALAQQIQAMFLRDLRKRAADLAGSTQEASKLLQHSSEALTRKHYRTKADQLRPVR